MALAVSCGKSACSSQAPSATIPLYNSESSERDSLPDSENSSIPQSLDRESSSESSFGESSCSDYSESASQSSSYEEDMNLGIDDFPFTAWEYQRNSKIFYWRDDAGKYRFATRPVNAGTGSNVAVSFSTIKAYTIQHNCPWYVMKEIVSRYWEEHPSEDNTNVFIEIPYPLEQTAVESAVNMDINISTRNRNLYSTIGLDDLYEKYYGESKQVYFEHYGLFSGKKSPVYSVYPAYFTNMSHIYRWTNDEGEIRYGVGPQEDGKITTSSAIRRMQEFLSCTFKQMKDIISAYYDVTDVKVENIIVDIPNHSGYSNFEESVASKYPDNVSTDRDLYEEFGIIDGFNSFSDKAI